MTNRYAIRAIKYFIYLAVLLALVYAILIIAGQTSFATVSNVMETDRKWLLLAMFIIIPLMQPFYGYVTREVRGRMVTDENRSKVLQTMELNRYKLVRETHGVMTFRAASTAARLRLLFEDEVKVTLRNDNITIEGPRKEVVKTEFRLKTFL